jgi:hypothetical protein
VSGWLPPVSYWGNEWDDEWLDPDAPSLSGHAPDVAPARRLPPRCGRVLACDGRFERGGVPGDPGAPPVCGRREGHRPPCRSAEAVARNYQADVDRARERSRAA